MFTVSLEVALIETVRPLLVSLAALALMCGGSRASAETALPYEESVAAVQGLVDRGEALDNDESQALYLQAIELSERLIVSYPDSARAHYGWALAAGDLALNLGGKDKVRLAKRIKEELDLSLTLDPCLVEAYRVRGVYYHELATLSRLLKLFARVLYGGLPEGSLEDAAADLERAIELDPLSAFSHYRLALTRYEQRDYDSALRLCDALKSLPDTDDQDGSTRSDAAALEKKVAKLVESRGSRRG